MANWSPGPPGGRPFLSAVGPPQDRLEQLEQELRWLLERESLERRAAIRELKERLELLERGAGGKPSQEPPEVAEKQAQLDQDQGSSDSNDDDSGEDSFCCPLIGCDEFVGRSMEVTASQVVENYNIEESAWDASVFIFMDCLGPTASVSTIALLLLNMVIQIFFLKVVWEFMCEDPFSEDFMKSLLHFRGSIAHDVKYADLSIGTSLARQICDEDQRLPWAGSQLGLVGDIKTSKTGGIYLCSLVVLCWLLTMMGELDASLRFGSAVVSLGRKGDYTRLVRGDSEGGSGVLQLLQISRRRVRFMVLAVVIPRIIICIGVAYVGVRFLVITTEMAELILNALALAFVVDVDNMLFSAFAPQRMKSLIRDLEPIPLPPRRRDWSPCKLQGLSTPARFLVVMGFLGVVFCTRIHPFYTQMNQAFNILCDGEKDFVVAHNSALGFVEAARSFEIVEDRAFSAQELAVLQLARPKKIHKVLKSIGAKGLFKKKNYISAILDMSYTDVQEHLQKMERHPGNPSANAKVHLKEAEGVQDLSADFHTLRDLRATAYNTGGRNVDRLACADMTASFNTASMREHLKIITNGRESCRDAAKMCSWMNMSYLRALCPVACGCRKLLAPAASFFASPSWGCPRKCETDFHSVLQVHKVSGEVLPCEDTAPENFILDPVLQEYIRKAMEFVMSRLDILVAARAAVTHDGKRVGIPSKGSGAAFKSIINGAFLNSTLEGQWLLVGGYPHPRGLQGCHYFASWEVGLMLGMDFCSPEKFRSLRAYCPLSCGCRMGGKQCPQSCYSKEIF